MKEIAIARKLLPFLKFYPWAALIIVVLGVISSLAEGLGISLLIPFLRSLEGKAPAAEMAGNSMLRVFYLLLARVNDSSQPFFIAGLIFTTILLKVALAYLYTVQVGWFNAHITHRLRCQAFAQLMAVGQQFWDKSKGGDLLNTLLQETNTIGAALNQLIWLVITACMIVTFVLLLLLISWPMTLMAAVALGGISLLVRRMTRQAETMGDRARTAGIHLRQTSLESITGIHTIRAFGHERYEQRQFEQASLQVRESGFRLRLLSASIDPIFEGAAVILLVGLMLITLWTEVSLPVLVTIIFMLYRLQPLVKKFDTSRTALLAASSSLDKLQHFLDRSDKPYIRSGPLPYTGLKTDIYLRNVNFRYGIENSPALRAVSLQLRRGETTAFVGPSGAGKSTLVSLLCRFYDVTQGAIEVDGQPLSELNLRQWRDRIALVSQQVHVFSTTLGENIAYGKLGATQAEVVSAARQANAHDFICQLPQGYDTPVGDRGVRLSGGQRQRIAIARAILRNPDILILDEATNALDSLSENFIQETLSRFGRDRTVLVIAHRLSTIEHADKIVVLKEGQVEESGTFEALLDAQGLFAQMYRLQYRRSQHIPV